MYLTNKYGMVCDFFVEMEHHCKNIVFKGVDFFGYSIYFFKSMNGKNSTTLMISQSVVMVVHIRKVFLKTQYRLCIWHIGENSKKNIKSLRSKEGFVELFNYMLKYADTISEFEFRLTK